MIATVPPTFRSAVAERINTANARLTAASRHLLAASGKGIRPRCVQLVGAALHPQGVTDDRHVQLGEAIELLHVGSLIHDDILDEAETRRGVSAVHVTFDAKVAVLAGDYLLSQASLLVAGLHNLTLTQRLAEVIAALCEGELMQDEQLRDVNLGFESYLERVAKKTAAPFELASEGAARLSGADARMAAVARRFGFHLGRQFQLVDDWLDWMSSEEELQKPVGQDLLAGSITLPVLVALHSEAHGARLRALLTPFPEHVSEEVRAIVLHPQNLAETAALIQAEGDRARRWLLEFPASPARDELEAMVTALMGRVAL
ncbi:MAG TPA: polyprenyl synthetase family protein [Oscillatoriaceae cyanobacterium]